MPSPVETKLIGELSIIIVTWNGDKLLSNCLNSLKTVYGEIPEIIVVDNANLNSTKQIVMGYSNCKYVSAESNLGFAGGNNLGLTYCSRDFVLLLNNDTFFHSDSISPLLNYLGANNHIAVVQGTMKLVRAGDKLDTCGTMLTHWGKLFLRHYMESVENTKLIPCPVFSAKGAFLLFRKRILPDLGDVLFYDFFFNNYEETDFCHRVWLSGHEVHFVPTDPIDHLQGASISKLERAKVRAQELANMYFSMRVNFGARGLICILPRFLFYHFLIWLRNMLFFRWKEAHVYATAISLLAKNLPSLALHRRMIQSQRRISDTALFKSILFSPGFKYWLSMFRLFIKGNI